MELLIFPPMASKIHLILSQNVLNYPYRLTLIQKDFFVSLWIMQRTSFFSQYSNYSLIAAKNRHSVTDDFLLVSRFHCVHHWYLRKQIVPPLSPILQNPLASSYSPSLPSRISSWTCPKLPKIFVLFLFSLVAGSLWNNVWTHCSCSNKRPHPFLFCNSSWMVLALDTLSSPVLNDCIAKSGPVNWPSNGAPHRCTPIWVVLSLDSLFLCVLECYTHNSYSANWLCNQNPPQTTMS